MPNAPTKGYLPSLSVIVGAHDLLIVEHLQNTKQSHSWVLRLTRKLSINDISEIEVATKFFTDYNQYLEHIKEGSNSA
jgi:hypothetical protein